MNFSDKLVSSSNIIVNAVDVKPNSEGIIEMCFEKLGKLFFHN